MAKTKRTKRSKIEVERAFLSKNRSIEALESLEKRGKNKKAQKLFDFERTMPGENIGRKKPSKRKGKQSPEKIEQFKKSKPKTKKK